MDLEFLELCWSNNLIPNFLKFKVTNNQLKFSKTYRDCQLRLLKQEINNKKSELRTKNKEFKVIKDDLTKLLTIVDFVHVINIFTLSNDKSLTTIQHTQKKKLYNLGYFEKDKNHNDPDQVIVNFSSYTLSDVEKPLLAKGLNFSLPPKILNFADHMTPFELLYKNILKCNVTSQNLDLLKVVLKNAPTRHSVIIILPRN